MTLKAIGRLEELAWRFSGVSLEMRRFATEWPMRWRARLVTGKNERDEYRVEVFADSAAMAIAKLLAEVRRIDEAKGGSDGGL